MASRRVDPQFMSKPSEQHVAANTVFRPTILLIGSTGNGKSTLGNFLLNPDEKYQIPRRGYQFFKTATSNKPETQVVQVGTDRKDNPTLRVVDTPGLNESGAQDLRHMVEMVRTLKKLEFITACILCIKFDTKIDAQYKATIAYYKKLLPGLFEGNILIVLTNFATDKRSQHVRKMQGTDVDSVVANTVEEVIRGGFVSFSPQVFLIDCIPVDFEPDDGNRQQSEDTRRAILDYIQTMHHVNVRGLTVAKTDALLRRDAEEIKRLDGEIHGYNVRLKEVNIKAGGVLADIEEAEKERSEVDRKLQGLKEELEDKDSLDHVTAAEWSLEKEWKLFRRQAEPVLCKSKWPIVEFTKWDNGHLKWVGLELTDDRTVRGRVEGEFCRGLYANVTAKTYKKLKYGEEISKLRESTRKQEQDHARLTQRLKQHYEQKREHVEDIKRLQSYIGDKNQHKKKLSTKYMQIKEAEKRLLELSQYL